MKKSSLITKAVAWSFVAGLAVAIAAASFGASAGILGNLVERAAGQWVDRQVGDVGKGIEVERLRLPVGGSFDGCAQMFPGGVPIDSARVAPQWRVLALCSNTFAVLHSGLTKTPLVVVERLSKGQLSRAKNVERTDGFYSDPRVPRDARAELDDYQSSGYDRGHLSSAANQPDLVAMRQSFALSNIVPQDGFNNRKVWSKVESDVRKFARRAAGDVYVYSGPVFRGKVQAIGPGRVWVPSHLFKLVYDASSGRAWAYVLPNTSKAEISTPLTYRAFVREVGWDFLAGAPINHEQTH